MVNMYVFTGKFMGEKEVTFSITNLSDREFDLVVKTESLDASEPILVNVKAGANVKGSIKLITMHFKGNRITILDSNEEFDLNNKALKQIPIRIKRVYCFISYNYDMKRYELDWN